MRHDDDEPHLSVGTLVAVLAVCALLVVLIALFGCAVAIGPGARADVRISAPIELEATANRKDEPKASARP